MAVDNRPFKSKEQDGQGNEVIIRDQQLVEQGTTTTMPAGTYFQTLDVDGRPVKISKDNMLNLIVEGLGIIFNGQSDQQTVTKIPTLNGNNFGASTVATLASVLGVNKGWHRAEVTGGTTYTIPNSRYGGYIIFTDDTLHSGTLLAQTCPYYVAFSSETTSSGVVIARTTQGGKITVTVPSGKNVMFLFLYLEKNV